MGANSRDVSLDISKPKYVKVMLLFRFRSSLSAEGANVTWSEGPQILTRWKVSAGSGVEPGSPGSILLESMILPEGVPLESLPQKKREVVNKSSCTTFVLWESPICWHQPEKTMGLSTTMGWFMDPSMPLPTDTMVRFATNYVMQSTRRGTRFTSGEQLDAFLENPRGYYMAAPAGAFKFVVPSSPTAEFREVSGVYNSSHVHHNISQSGNKVRSYGGYFKGQKDLATNSNSAPGKYVKEPHPYFFLSPSALPIGTPPGILNKAQESFSCSVSRNTQSNYATAVRHMKMAEAALGRQFNLPMTEFERAYFTTFIINKGVKKCTAAGYWTALRSGLRKSSTKIKKTPFCIVFLVNLCI